MLIASAQVHAEQQLIDDRYTQTACQLISKARNQESAV
jgi:hypothetical protein